MADQIIIRNLEIYSNHGVYKEEKVVYYEVDLGLTYLESNEVVWMGEKRVKEQVSDRAC